MSLPILKFSFLLLWLVINGVTADSLRGDCPRWIMKHVSAFGFNAAVHYAPFKGDQSNIRDFMDTNMQDYLNNPDQTIYAVTKPSFNITGTDKNAPTIGHIYDTLPETNISNFTLFLTGMFDPDGSGEHTFEIENTGGSAAIYIWEDPNDYCCATFDFPKSFPNTVRSYSVPTNSLTSKGSITLDLVDGYTYYIALEYVNMNGDADFKLTAKSYSGAIIDVFGSRAVAIPKDGECLPADTATTIYTEGTYPYPYTYSQTRSRVVSTRSPSLVITEYQEIYYVETPTGSITSTAATTSSTSSPIVTHAYDSETCAMIDLQKFTNVGFEAEFQNEYYSTSPDLFYYEMVRKIKTPFTVKLSNRYSIGTDPSIDIMVPATATANTLEPIYNGIYDVSIKNFAVVLKGYFHAPVTGDYTFSINEASDAATIFIMDDIDAYCCGAIDKPNWIYRSTKVINIPQQPLYNTEKSKTVHLTAGTAYFLTMTFYNNGGDALFKPSVTLPSGEVITDFKGYVFSQGSVYLPSCSIGRDSLTTTTSWTGVTTTTSTSVSTVHETLEYFHEKFQFDQFIYPTEYTTVFYVMTPAPVTSTSSSIPVTPSTISSTSSSLSMTLSAVTSLVTSSSVIVSSSMVSSSDTKSLSTGISSILSSENGSSSIASSSITNYHSINISLSSSSIWSSSYGPLSISSTTTMSDLPESTIRKDHSKSANIISATSTISNSAQYSSTMLQGDLDNSSFSTHDNNNTTLSTSTTGNEKPSNTHNSKVQLTSNYGFSNSSVPIVSSTPTRAGDIRNSEKVSTVTSKIDRALSSSLETIKTSAQDSVVISVTRSTLVYTDASGTTKTTLVRCSTSSLGNFQTLESSTQIKPNKNQGVSSQVKWSEGESILTNTLLMSTLDNIDFKNSVGNNIRQTSSNGIQTEFIATPTKQKISSSETPRSIHTTSTYSIEQALNEAPKGSFRTIPLVIRLIFPLFFI